MIEHIVFSSMAKLNKWLEEQEGTATVINVQFEWRGVDAVFHLFCTLN